MLYVVAYDVSDDRRRTRVAQALEGFGVRVQESVFECRLNSKGLVLLQRSLARALGDGLVGQVRVYPVCHDCAAGAFGFGTLVHANEGPIVV